MKKLYAMIIFSAVLLPSSLVVNNAYAIGWANNQTPKISHYTMIQIGQTKVCGDHMCTPFEYAKMQQSLSATQKNNQAIHFLKQNSLN